MREEITNCTRKDGKGRMLKRRRKIIVESRNYKLYPKGWKRKNVEKEEENNS